LKFFLIKIKFPLLKMKDVQVLSILRVLLVQITDSIDSVFSFFFLFYVNVAGIFKILLDGSR